MLGHWSSCHGGPGRIFFPICVGFIPFRAYLMTCTLLDPFEGIFVFIVMGSPYWCKMTSVIINSHSFRESVALVHSSPQKV